MKHSFLLVFFFALIAALIVPEQLLSKTYLGHHYYGNLEKKVPKGEGSICIGNVSKSLRIDGTFDGQNVYNATAYICTGYIDKNNSTTFKGDVYFDESDNITLKAGGIIDIEYYVWSPSRRGFLETKVFSRVLEKDELVNLANFEPSIIKVDIELPLPDYIKIDNAHDISGKFVSIPVTMRLGGNDAWQRNEDRLTLRGMKIFWDIFSLPRFKDIQENLVSGFSVEDEKGGKWLLSLDSKANEELFEKYKDSSDYSKIIKELYWNWNYISSENWAYLCEYEGHYNGYKSIKETAFIIFPDTTSVTMTCEKSLEGEISHVDYVVRSNSIGYRIKETGAFDMHHKLELYGYIVENGVLKKMEPTEEKGHEAINWINYWKDRDSYVSLCYKGDEIDILNNAIEYDSTFSTSKEKMEDMLSNVFPHVLFVKYDSDKREYSTTLPTGDFVSIQLNGTYMGRYYDGKY